MMSKYLLEDDENISREKRFSVATQPSDTEKPTFQRRFGQNIVFFWHKNEPLCSLGPHRKIFAISITIFILIGILVYFLMATTQSATIQIIFILLIIFEALTYLYTGLKNPGIYTAKSYNEVTMEDYRLNQNFCPKCRILRDIKTYHCLDCDVCIKGYDHHCPWTGKCIGSGNLYPFYAFLFSTAIYFTFFILFILSAVTSS